MTENVQDTKKRRSCLIVVVIILALFICVLCIAAGYGVWKRGTDFIPEDLMDNIPIDLPQEVGEEPMPQGEPDYEEDTLQWLTANDKLEILQIFSNAAEGETSGQILEVEVVNNNAEDVFFVVPCGTVLLPDDQSQQRMMVVQQASTAAAPGEIVILPMHVVCIDAGATAPDSGSTFQLGKPIQGELGEFADCLCEQNLSTDEFEMMTLQFAIWSAAEGDDLDQLAAEGDNALSSMVSEGSMEGVMEMYAMFMEMYSASAQQWLDRCGINP